MLQNYFKLKEHNSSVRTELLAGVVTFTTMAYIIVVNPAVLAVTGMPQGALMTATILSAGISTLIMALYAKLPFALAPGMGINAFFAYTIVVGMGKSVPFALTAVLLSGIVFLLITVLNIREIVVNAIPVSLQKAIASGIGLFIAVIGLTNAGVIEHSYPLLALGDITAGGTASLALIGILVIGILLALRIKGALLIGIIITTLIGIPMGVTNLSGLSSPVSLPASLAPIFFHFDFSELLSLDMLIVVMVLVFINLFNTIGTLVGVATKAKMFNKAGQLPGMKQAFLSDAIASIVSAVMGTSPVVTYVESAAGVAQGGRTGLTALTVAALFFVALFLSPLFLIIPAAATAPALFIVGLFMLSPITEINFDDFSEAIPAFFTILMMPLSYSITDGIAFGIISYVVIKLFSGKIKQIKPATYVVAAVFLAMQFYFNS
ncbi:MAG: NCS2 family permease [Spirochaetaceae bacterium]|nr:NCS2 family permease [Spirochaetaceae bacterium]